jgi:hypothetical protein
LNRYFGAYGIKGSVEKRNFKVLALTHIDKNNHKAFSDSTSQSINYSNSKFLKIVNQPMQFFLSQLSPYMKVNLPVINETGYNGTVSIEINGEMSGLDNVNTSLAKYGMKFIEKEAPMDVIIITKTSDRKKIAEINRRKF